VEKKVGRIIDEAHHDGKNKENHLTKEERNGPGEKDYMFMGNEMFMKSRKIMNNAFYCS